MRSQRFNATTSDVSFGVRAAQAPIAQTVMMLIYPIGAGEINVGYMFSRTPSASTSGPRLLINDNTANPALFFGGHSTGTAAAPSHTGSNNSIAYGKWQHVAATWDGSLLAANIHLYVGIGGVPLAEITYAGTVGGTIAADGGAGNNLHVGNREGTDRTYNGDIAYVAQWNRALTLAELWKAQRFGPLAVRGGLILFWDGERDLGPYGMESQIVALAPGFTIPPQFKPAPRRRMYVNANVSLPGAGGSPPSAFDPVLLSRAWF